MFPKGLKKKLDKRKEDYALRQLKTRSNGIDFSSNDYLGFSKHHYNFESLNTNLGATGSRLLTGHSSIFETVEVQVAKFHNVESALIFNSGYDANLGLLSCVLQRGDLVFYDELSHASIRDGITMSYAKSIKFKHNNLQNLQELLETKTATLLGEVYIVTESVFSMDGNSPDLNALVKLSKTYNANLIIDEAHAFGVFGNTGEGLVQHLDLEHDIFARVVTYGKALGCHGASVLGSQKLKEFLINFSRPFIFTTALPSHSMQSIFFGYQALLKLSEDNSVLKHLQKNISFFRSEIDRLQLKNVYIESKSAIQSCIIPGNTNVKKASAYLEKQGFDVRPIVSPTVPLGQERLRFCLHSYNSVTEITKVLQHLATFVTYGEYI